MLKLRREGEVNVDDGSGASAKWKLFAKPESKNDSKVSSARTNMRNVGNVICTGLAGSRAAFASACFGVVGVV